MKALAVAIVVATLTTSGFLNAMSPAMQEENDAFFQLQTSLKLHAPWLELDIEGKQRLNRAALIEQIIESHQKRTTAYEHRIALLRKLQFADR